MYAFSSIRDSSIPKSVKCAHSATKQCFEVYGSDSHTSTAPNARAPAVPEACTVEVGGGMGGEGGVGGGGCWHELPEDHEDTVPENT